MPVCVSAHHNQTEDWNSSGMPQPNHQSCGHVFHSRQLKVREEKIVSMQVLSITATIAVFQQISALREM